MKIRPLHKTILPYFKQMLAFSALVLIFSACNDSTTTSDQGHDHDHAHGDMHDHDHDHDHDDGHDHASENVVVWPELTNLDELSHMVLANHQAEKFEANEELAPEFKSSFEALLKSEIPSNVKNSEQVNLVLADINSMQSIMNDYERFGSAEVMSTTMDAIAVSVEKLVEASGIPHVHAKASNDESHTHDHSHDDEEHSHDHDHTDADHDHSHDEHSHDHSHDGEEHSHDHDHTDADHDHDH